MLRFEQASSEEKIPLGQRTVFFQMYCFPPIYMKQYMRLYRASCEKRIFFLQQLTIHVGMRWKWRKEVDFLYQALLYLIMMNVKKIIFFKSIIFYALLESC